MHVKLYFKYITLADPANVVSLIKLRNFRIWNTKHKCSDFNFQNLDY